MRLALTITIFVMAVMLGSGLQAASFDSTPFFKRYCVECHNKETKESGLDLTSLEPQFDSAALTAKWVRLHDRVRAGEMPPAGETQPSAAEKAAFLKSLSAELTQSHRQSKQTVLRRLNRHEYERTLNELLGVSVQVADMLPEDGKAHGFDNIGDALDLSPVQMQRYMDAAGMALDAAANFGPKPESKVHELRFDTGRNEKNIGEHWHRRVDGAVVFYLDGGYPGIKVQEFRVPMSGRYRVRVHAAAHQSNKPMTYAVHFGRDSLEDPTVFHSFHEALPGDIRVEEFEASIRRESTLRLFLHGLDPSVNHWAAVNKKADKFTGPGLAVLKIEVDGPLIGPWPGRGHRLRFGDLPSEDKGPTNQRDKSWYKPQWRLVTANPQADVEKLLPPFVTAAFRRPVDDATLAPFVALAKAELARGAILEQALRTAQVAVLCAPDFLYLFEEPNRLSEHALAARLSYFIGSLPPDAELLKAAQQGQLSDPKTLRLQTERLLSEARLQHFTRNFIGQWLNLREIDFTTPDKQLYPEYDEQLRQAMPLETELYFQEMLSKNRSVLEFIDSNWTFLNERLARHYGINDVTGIQMRRIALQPEHQRGGVLTHASVLKVSANGTTTSPVTRGAYVLQRILGIDPPPPPPGVPGVEPDIRGASTLRELLAKHRSLPTCNSCHRIIDPPGFALENYDVMGGWRKNYRSLGQNFPRPEAAMTRGRNVPWRVGPLVDASGQTSDGQSFSNLQDYKQLLLKQPRQFTRALAEKLATYATGRGMGFSDRAELDRITQVVAERGSGFRDLVHEVVQSELFRTK